MKIVRIFLQLFFFALSNLSHSQQILLKQSNASGIYQQGEKVQITLYAKDQHTDSVTVRIRKNFSTQAITQQLKYPGDSLIVYTELLKEPETVIVEASTRTDTVSMGCIVAPETFKPATERPKDFDEFWNAEKNALRSLPMDIKSVALKELSPGFMVSDMEINCT